MANISQGAPGFVDKPGSQKEQISESTSNVDGKDTRVVLYSDGSRKVWINGVLDHEVPVFSDAEKAAASVEAPSELVPNDADAQEEAQAEDTAIAQRASDMAASGGFVGFVDQVETDAAQVEAEVVADVKVDEAEVVADVKTDESAPNVAEVVTQGESLLEEVKGQVEKVAGEVVTDLKDLEFKSIAELKALAAKLGIDLGGATKKEDILTKVQDAQPKA